jgi:hypothetical protein
MYWLNAIFSGFLALFFMGFIPMMGIFIGASFGETGNQSFANIFMYSSFLLAVLTVILNILGQVQYARLEDGAPTMIPLLYMYAGIPFVILLFAIALIITRG